MEMGQAAAVLVAVLLVASVHADLVSRDRQLQLVPLLGSSVTTGQGILGPVQLWRPVPGSNLSAFVPVCDLPTQPTWNNAAAQVSCKAFGYRQGVALLGPASSYTAAVFNVTCTGSEDTLASCPSRQAEQQQTCRAAVLACTGPTTPTRSLSPVQLVAAAVGATLGGLALLGCAGWVLARAWQRRQQQQQQQQAAHPTSRRHRKKGGGGPSSAAAEEAAAIAHVVVQGGRRNSLDKARQSAALPASTIPGSSSSGRLLGRTSIDVSAAVMAAQRAASMSARQPSSLNRQPSIGREGGSTHRSKQRDGSGSGAHASMLLHHHLHQQQGSHGGSHRRTSESNSSRGSGHGPNPHTRRTSYDSCGSKGTNGHTSDPGAPGDPTGVSQVTQGDRVAARAARLAASWNLPASDGEDGEQQQQQQQQQGALSAGGGVGAGGYVGARAAHFPDSIPEESSNPPSLRSSVHLPQGYVQRSNLGPNSEAAACSTQDLV